MTAGGDTCLGNAIVLPLVGASRMNHDGSAKARDLRVEASARPDRSRRPQLSPRARPGRLRRPAPRPATRSGWSQRGRCPICERGAGRSSRRSARYHRKRRPCDLPTCDQKNSTLPVRSEYSAPTIIRPSSAIRRLMISEPCRNASVDRLTFSRTTASTSASGSCS